MKILFAGSSDFSLPSLKTLIDCGLVHAVVTATDKPSGRGLKMQATAVKEYAQQHDIEVLQPEKIDVQFGDDIMQRGVDTLVCSAYGKIFPAHFLNIFTKGTVNVHPSLLPRFRGAAPIPATIFAGDTHTGVTLQKLAKEMDCGDVILQSEYPLQGHETTDFLLAELAEQSAMLMNILVEDFENLYSKAIPQKSDNAVYCQKILSTHGFLTWMENATHINRLIRGFGRPYSGVKTLYKGMVLKFWEGKALPQSGEKKQTGAVLGVDDVHGILIQTVCGIIGITSLQLPGRKCLSWREFLQGEADILQYVFNRIKYEGKQ